jgi:hypothetical protein
MIEKLCTLDQYVSFHQEGYNFSFTEVEFYTIKLASTSYGINIGM